MQQNVSQNSISLQDNKIESKSSNMILKDDVTLTNQYQNLCDGVSNMLQLSVYYGIESKYNII